MSLISETPRQFSPQKRTVFPLLLMVIGSAIILFGGLILTMVIKAEQTPLTVPESLATVPLTAEITGDDALAEISRLHGKNFPLVGGVMGVYGGGTATLWVSSTWLPVMAYKQLEAMTDRIAEGNSPFKPLETREFSGTTVYSLTGMGQLHFYFAHKQQLYWLAADTNIAEIALNELLAQLQ